MVLKIKVRHHTTQEIFFLVILFAYVVLQLLKASNFAYLLPSFLFEAYNYALIGCLFFYLIVSILLSKYSIQYLIIMCLVIGVLGIMALFNNYTSLIIALLLIIDSKKIDFKSILKCIAFGLVFTTFIIVLSCKLNILDDYTYSHYLGDTVRIAHSYGFKYYGDIGYISMTLTAIYLYLHPDVSFTKLVILALANYGLYLIHTTKLAIILSIILIIAYVFTRKIKILHFDGRLWKFCATIIPSFLCLGTIELVHLYQKHLLLFSSNFSTLNSRLKYSAQAINKYGFSLFGTKIEMYGNTQYFYGNATSIFYIDSGFLYSCLAYGVLFTVLILVLYTIVYRYLAKNNDAFLFAWMSILLVACVVNNFLISWQYNPLMFLLPYAILSLNNHEHKRKKNLS